MDLLSSQVNQNEINIIIGELRRVITSNIIGDVVEMGCYIGTTSVFIAKELLKTDKKFYVYDSFEGLPEKMDQDKSAIGGQFKAGELVASKKQFIMNIKRSGAMMPIIKKAWFSDLTANDLPEKIALAFLDGDYYSSIIDSFRVIEKSLSSDSVIIVDDYINDALPGVRLAVDEWLSTRKTKIRLEQSLAIIYML